MNPTPTPHQFKSPRSLTVAVKTLLITGGVIGVLSLVVTLAGTMVTPFTEEEVGENPVGFTFVLLEFGLGLISFLVYLASAVVYLIWIYRCYSNLPAFGNPRGLLSYSPGWAIGVWFIPLANLVWPYRLVRETWEKSTPFHQTLLQADQPTHWFPLWWAFWLISNFVGNIYGRLALREGTDPTTLATLSVASDITSILAAIFAVVIVIDIDRRQEESSKSLQIGKYAVPPSPPTTGSPPLVLETPPPY